MTSEEALVDDARDRGTRQYRTLTRQLSQDHLLRRCDVPAKISDIELCSVFNLVIEHLEEEMRLFIFSRESSFGGLPFQLPATKKWPTNLICASRLSGARSLRERLYTSCSTSSGLGQPLTVLPHHLATIVMA